MNKISSIGSSNTLGGNSIGSSTSTSSAGGSGNIGQMPASASPAEMNSWYEAMARAWGSALDGQASRITEMSGAVSEGGQDQPSTMTMLTAESMRMQFMSQNASTSMTSVGQALESLGRKQ